MRVNFEYGGDGGMRVNLEYGGDGGMRWQRLMKWAFIDHIPVCYVLCFGYCLLFSVFAFRCFVFVCLFFCVFFCFCVNMGGGQGDEVGGMRVNSEYGRTDTLTCAGQTHRQTGRLSD